MTQYTPDRGDVVWLSLAPQAGREQKGRRPALVLSPKSYNRLTGLCVVCPITSRVKGYPFEVCIPEGFAVEGVVLADQLKSLDWNERRAELICRLPETVSGECSAKGYALIGGAAV